MYKILSQLMWSIYIDVKSSLIHAMVWYLSGRLKLTTIKEISCYGILSDGTHGTAYDKNYALDIAGLLH